MHKNTTLIIIDAQVNMFDETMPVHRAGEVLANLKVLCQKAREAGVPIIFVRHDGGKGAIDEYNTPGWQVHPQLMPQDSDIFVDKRSSDAFQGTDLQDQLNQRDIDELVIAGMQTELCVNATTRRATELGFEVTLVSDAHSTFDDTAKAAAELIAEYNAALGDVAVIKRVDEVSFFDPL